MDKEDDVTLEEAQEAVEAGDFLTRSELEEMYPDDRGLSLHRKVEEMQDPGTPPPPPEEPRMRARQGRKTYHTGPKGVLTDHEEAKLKMRARRLEEERQKKQNVYMRLESDELQPFQILEKKEIKQRNFSKKYFDDSKDNKNNKDKNDSDSDILSDDEELMIKYKNEKLKLLNKYANKYGNMPEVNAFNFEKEVYNAPKNEWVIVNIFQDYLKRCNDINYCLAQVAKAYPYIKFVRARSDRIGLDSYPEMGLPTILCVKNGVQVHNFIAFHNLIGGEPYTPKKCEEFFLKNKIIVKNIILNNKPTYKDLDDYNEKLYKEKQDKIDMKNNKNKINIKNNLFSNKYYDDESSGSELDID